MKIENLKHLDIERIGDVDDSIKAGIAEDSLPFVFDIISRQLYSNPIGSIIREITSNCLDSHTEAKVEEPVIIRKVYDADEEQYYIEFQDFGVGLSPERVQSIYMNYFSSTKRDNNQQIGGFGLGSKTPFAYSDFFYITTRYEGIEYGYIFHKGEDKPTLDPLYEEETTERNGTIIKVPIKNRDDYHQNDCYLFEEELKNQLLYFDSVYFENWGINNEYSIYEGKHFKFRSDINTSKNIHICMGKVTYPIDFEKIKCEYKRLPIGVKFEIGELPVTPSREEIRYSEEVKKIISNRIDLAIKEVLERYNNQNPEIDDFEQYLILRDSTPKLKFNEDGSHYLKIDSDYVSSNYKFSPISNIGIKRIPKNLFFEYRVAGTITNGLFKEIYNDFHDYNSEKFVILGSGQSISKYAGLYINERVGNCIVVRKKQVPYNEYCKILKLTGKTLGKSKIILSYSKAIDKIIKDLGNDYNNLKPTDEWIENYKRERKIESAAFQRRQSKKVFVRHYLNKYRYNDKYTKTEDIPEYELENRTGITIYGFREDKKDLEYISEIVECKRSIAKSKDLRKACIVIQVARNTEKFFRNNKRAVYCKDFYKLSFFKKIATAHLLNEELDLIKLEKYSKYLPGIEQPLKEVRDFISKNKYEHYNSVLFTARKLNAFIPEMTKYLDTLNINRFHLPLIDKLSYIDEETEKELIEYFKFKKIRLNNIFYLKQLKEEQENGNTEQNQESHQEIIESSSEEISSEEINLSEGTNTTEESSEIQPEENRI